MPFFTGEHDSQIGAKRRLAISSALREEIDPEDGNLYYLVLGPDRKLWLYPNVYYRKLAAKMKRSLLPTKQTRSLSLFFAMARLLKPDSQGRVVLPEKSLQRAGLEKVKKVTLVGDGDHFVLWPADDWEKHVQESMDSYEDMLNQAAAALACEDNEPKTVKTQSNSPVSEEKDQEPGSQ